MKQKLLVLQGNLQTTNLSKKQLAKFYLKTMPPLFIALTILFLAREEVCNIALFTFGYTWVLLFKAPNLAEKVKSKKYRYSFIRLIFYLDSSIVNRKFFLNSGDKIKSIIRCLTPFIFATLLFTFTSDFKVFLTLVGAMVAQLVFFNYDLG